MLYRKRYIMKNMIMISLILALAIISTYVIYYHFREESAVDYSSESLEIVYHEKNGNKILLNKITPLADSVGLSSKAHTISISNNLTREVRVRIQLVDDIKAIEEDKCGEFLIPKENIRVSIKFSNEGNEIYTLGELESGILAERDISALEKTDITIRFWVSKDSDLVNGSILHYHGKIIVEEITDIGN